MGTTTRRNLGDSALSSRTKTGSLNTRKRPLAIALDRRAHLLDLALLPHAASVRGRSGISCQRVTGDDVVAWRGLGWPPSLLRNGHEYHLVVFEWLRALAQARAAITATSQPPRARTGSVRRC
jgi:hypothetical protein